MMTWPGCNWSAFGSLSKTTIFDKGPVHLREIFHVGAADEVRAFSV